jgi:hypothetical protein
VITLALRLLRRYDGAGGVAAAAEADKTPLLVSGSLQLRMPISQNCNWFPGFALISSKLE